MDTPCHRGKNRKYAANSKLTEHTGMPQRLYLRFLCAKRAACSWVPEFAAYFRRAVPEVRGKTEIDRPDPGFTLPRPAVLLPKIGLCSAVSDFSPHFRNYSLKPRVQVTVAASATTSSCRGNVKGPLPENRTTTLLCHRLT